MLYDSAVMHRIETENLYILRVHFRFKSAIKENRNPNSKVLLLPCYHLLPVYSPWLQTARKGGGPYPFPPEHVTLVLASYTQPSRSLYLGAASHQLIDGLGALSNVFTRNA